MAATTTKRKTRQDFAGAISATVTEKKASPAKEKKAGRPSTGKTTKITLAIPEDMMEGIDSASLLHKGNRTAYINSLIRKDLAENLEKYQEFDKLING